MRFATNALVIDAAEDWLNGVSLDETLQRFENAPGHMLREITESNVKAIKSLVLDNAPSSHKTTEQGARLFAGQILGKCKAVLLRRREEAGAIPAQTIQKPKGPNGHYAGHPLYGIF